MAAGGKQKAVGGKRKALNTFCFPPACFHRLPAASGGFTLIELVITLTVLTIMTLGVLPLVKISVKRQREERLREALREMRTAIDQFHREALLAPGAGTQSGIAGVSGQAPNPPVTTGNPANPANQNQQVFVDPRVKVYVSDMKIFTVDNPDRYPPDLDTLVTGVTVMPLATNNMGGRGDANVDATKVGEAEAASQKTKIYLRSIPVDPITGKAEWCFHSSYTTDSKACEDHPVNVFDVSSKSTDTALNGEQYSDW